MKKRIAFVVQRYGLEVNGGSELHCRLIAERLTDRYDVDVLTTKAVDYVTWENHYPNDIDQINGVTVRRFATKHPRDLGKFNKYTSFLMAKTDRTIFEEYEWMRLQGPASYALLKYLNDHHESYEAIIFFTYLYFTTYFGLQIAPGRSVFVPTAHDEPPIYLSLFRPLFHLPRFIAYNTQEERNFVHSRFGNQYIPNDVVGIGVNIPDKIPNEQQFRIKFNISDDFVIYVGRIDESKGCKELVEYFMRYKSECPSDLKLVLLGKPVMGIPEHPDIVPLGFVSDEDKFGAMKAAKVLINPSKYESLSMVVLESMYMETPVLVNGQSEVLRGHCDRGNGGLYYSNYDEFKMCLSFLCNQDEVRNKLGIQGKKYIEENYQWMAIIEKFTKAIEMVSNLR